MAVGVAVANYLVRLLSGLRQGAGAEEQRKRPRWRWLGRNRVLASNCGGSLPHTASQVSHYLCRLTAVDWTNLVALVGPFKRCLTILSRAQEHNEPRN